MPPPSPALLQHVQSLPLPGNVRELENLLHRYVALGDEGLGQTPTAPLAAFTAPHGLPQCQPPLPPPPSPQVRPPTRLQPPRQKIPSPKDMPSRPGWMPKSANCSPRPCKPKGGDITAAAAHLGLEPTQIQYRLQRLHLPHPNGPLAHAPPPPPTGTEGWLCAPHVQHLPSPKFGPDPLGPALTWPCCTPSACRQANTAPVACSNCLPTSLTGQPTRTLKAFAAWKCRPIFSLPARAWCGSLFSADDRAWHAGASAWRGRSNCNDDSIGIELKGWRAQPLPPPQYRALAGLLEQLAAQYPLAHLAGHEHIAPGRKHDPGPGFPGRSCWPCCQRHCAHGCNGLQAHSGSDGRVIAVLVVMAFD